MRIIPAIDLIEGQCVRLVQGSYDHKKIYHKDPLEVAKTFEDNGLKHLHLVDLDGAKAGRVLNWKVLERLATKTKLKIDFGGGVQSDRDVSLVFECGASQITGGSVAVKKTDLFKSWLEKYGSQKVLLGADVRNDKIAISGWQKNAKVNWLEFLKYWRIQGVEYAICTDVRKDGMLQGPSLEWYANMLEAFPKLKLIASGGVSSMDDLKKLQNLGVEGVIIGKAIYEGRISLTQLSAYVN